MADKGKIIGKEIFSTGNWNGDDYIMKDLEEMVETFNATNSNYKPYIKLGHDEDQKLLQNDGLPSAGWVENLRIKGTKLVCDIVDIPDKIFKLIKDNAYRYVSSEIFWNINFNGQEYPKMLAGVALLGSDMPAVGNLNDFANLYKFDYSKVRKYNLSNNSKVEDTSTEFTNKIEDNMPTIDKVHVPAIIDGKKEEMAAPIAPEVKPEVKEPMADAPKVEAPKEEMPVKKEEEAPKKEEMAAPSIEELGAQVAELQKQVAELLAKLGESEVELKKHRIDIKAKEIENFISVNRIAPAAVDYVKEMLGDEKKEYSVNEKKLSKSDLLAEVIKVYSAANVNLVESSSAPVIEKVEAEDKDLEAVKKFAKDNNLDYSKEASKVYKMYFASKDVESEEGEE